MDQPFRGEVAFEAAPRFTGVALVRFDAFATLAAFGAFTAFGVVVVGAATEPLVFSDGFVEAFTFADAFSTGAFADAFFAASGDGVLVGDAFVVFAASRAGVLAATFEVAFAATFTGAVAATFTGAVAATRFDGPGGLPFRDFPVALVAETSAGFDDLGRTAFATTASAGLTAFTGFTGFTGLTALTGLTAFTGLTALKDFATGAADSDTGSDAARFGTWRFDALATVFPVVLFDLEGDSVSDERSAAARLAALEPFRCGAAFVATAGFDAAGGASSPIAGDDDTRAVAAASVSGNANSIPRRVESKPMTTKVRLSPRRTTSFALRGAGDEIPDSCT